MVCYQKNDKFLVRNFDSYIGTEELAHLEMVSTMVHQLTCNLSLEEIQNSGFANYYVDHTAGVWPQAAGGIPFNACEFQSKGDPLTDLFEDLAAEQKARSTYDNILRLVKDPEVADPIRFLRAREIVHFQRFGEANHTNLRRIWKKISAAGCFCSAYFSYVPHYFSIAVFVNNDSIYKNITHTAFFFQGSGFPFF